ncbi:MAG: TMEM165/GDT1 family protein [Bacillota bacterium]
MDWRLFGSAFGLVFLAELGDKTQLATMMLSARCGSPVTVFLGAILAMVINVGLAAILGAAVVRVVPQEYIRYGAGGLFVILGGMILLGR